MLTARHEAIRLLKLMMVASIVLPAVLFGFAAWVSYRNFEKVTDERIERSLDILHEHALKVLQTIERTFGEIDEVLRGMSDDDIRRDEGPLHERLKRLVQVAAATAGHRHHGPRRPSAGVVQFRAGAARRRIFRTANISRSRTKPTPAPMSAASAAAHARHRHLFLRGDAAAAIAGRQIQRHRVDCRACPGYFETFYGRMGANEGSYFALAREDGGFLARFPVPEDRAQKLDENSEFIKGVRKQLQSFHLYRQCAARRASTGASATAS